MATVDFTGMVYRLDTLGGILNWQRIDSTYYSGYNLGNLVFFANNRVYSFGGAGLWQMTGHLRYYQPEKFEWEIQPLSREIPHFSDLKDAYWLDSAANQFYMIARKLATPTLIDNSAQYEAIANRAWKLDLKTGIWNELGSCPDTTFGVIGNSPWGLFYVTQNFLYIADFKNNRYLKGNLHASDRFSRYFRAKDKQIIFFSDSTLWFGDNQNYIDSVRFSAADFFDTGRRIYQPRSNDTGEGAAKRIFLTGILALAVAVSGWQFWKKQKRASAPEMNQTPSTSKEKPRLNVNDGLEEKELLVLRFILNKSLNNEVASIDEINRQLGLHLKSPEIQKSHRNKTIESINQKLKILIPTDQPVVARRPNEADRRSNDYFISPNHLSLLANALLSRA